MAVTVSSDNTENGSLTITGSIASNGSIEIRTRDDGSARTAVRENGNIVFQQDPRPNVYDASAVTARAMAAFR